MKLLLLFHKNNLMEKCKNCGKIFEAYQLDPSTISVFNQPAIDVLRLRCPECGETQHILPSIDDSTPSSGFSAKKKSNNSW
jgi:ribosomal protein S27E